MSGYHLPRGSAGEQLTRAASSPGHRALAALARAGGVELLHGPATPGVALLCVGSGLLLATWDLLVASGAPPHCAADIGRVPEPRMAELVAWACQASEHRAVVLHTWHSRSSAAALARALLAQGLPGASRCPLVLRLRGLEDDAIPPGLPVCRELVDLAARVRALLAPGEKPSDRAGSPGTMGPDPHRDTS